jgi:pantoate--beta-alanine ligase
MRLGIMGTGALASLFAARLSSVAEVVMVGSWQAQIAAVQAHGLTLLEMNGRSASHPLAITNDPHSVAPVDVVLVLVKSYQTQTAVTRIQPLLSPNGLVITLQNGLGNAEILREGLPTGHVSVGVTSLGATIVAPGVVRHAGEGPVHLAPPSTAHDLFLPVVALLQQAGFAAEITENVDSLVWGKLAVNAGINPLTAVLNVPNGYLADHAEARAVMMAAAQETAVVAAAQAIQLPYADAGERVLAVARATAPNRSSMLQDLDRGSRTEIDAICGAVVKIGEKVGVETAVNQQLYTWVKQLESGQPITNWCVKTPEQLVNLADFDSLKRFENNLRNLRNLWIKIKEEPMKVTGNIQQIRDIRWQDPSLTWGLVPTMGYLHEGHLSLVRRALAENDSVMVTIYVNPTQFAPSEDLSAYPRDLERDLALLQGVGAHVVFTPNDALMYPKGFQSYVSVEEVTKLLEGASRPTHFRGVATIVAKLFNIAQPTRAYFGQKDYQQTAVLRQMVSDLNFNLEMVICPSVREADGLAMSSRNKNLSPEQRRAAPLLHQALMAGIAALQTGERDAQKIRQLVTQLMTVEPLARLDYFSVADPDTLLELDWVGEKALLSTAVFFGNTRLIDNELWQIGGQ